MKERVHGAGNFGKTPRAKRLRRVSGRGGPPSSPFPENRGRRNAFRIRGFIQAMALLAPVAAMLIQAAVSRSREYPADDGGADVAGSSLGLASALEKPRRGASRGMVTATATPETANLYIVNPLNLKGLGSLFATHPPLVERVQIMRGMRMRPSARGGRKWRGRLGEAGFPPRRAESPGAGLRE
ncbi:MAG: M48 family metalloprotease [Deltaproteobacteria bacterium]|jgi:hypothetical protein|nr:M48 family metalloprotease [Deltaproteobacteria bacterium]